MIYFDNAATTQYKPQQVIDAVNDSLRNSTSANRSNHNAANAATFTVNETRTKVARLLDCPREECVTFTKNCTEALNLAIIGSARSKGHVITTLNEHNSIVRPLMELKKRHVIDITFVTPDQQGNITPEKISQAVKQNTYMVVMSAVSNVTGKAQDLQPIGRLLNSANITFAVDGAQAVGYIPLSMKNAGIDLLALPAHKGLHGIQGLGALCFAPSKMPYPINYGGTGSDSVNLYQPEFAPDCYESGTLNLPAIAALNAACDWWTLNCRVNLPRIRELCTLLHTELAYFDKIKVYSQPNASGIVSFSVDQHDSNEIGDALNEKNIAVRCGLHCAPLTHRYLGSEKHGLVRVSLSGENTIDECYLFLSVMDKLLQSI